MDYVSGDPSLAAAAANGLAEAYIDWQRQAKLEQTKHATTWLSAQIEELRQKVSESEAAAEPFRSSNGLFEGSSNVTLNAQQLSELNSQVILAKAQKSEAEARARLIKKMLDEKSDIDATPEVLKSELIGRLIEQRVQVQRQLAELSATLLPSHPRIKQLKSELADVRSQIQQEGDMVVKDLENEAEVASARETSLRNSLNEVKSQASGQSEAEIKLRALEREAKANRDLLESYLARYRNASARHDMGAVPASATIVSRAHAASQPSFPKRGAFSALAAAAMALLALAFVFARVLIVGTAAPAPRAAPEANRRHVPRAASLLPESLGATEPMTHAATAEAQASASPAKVIEASPPPKPLGENTKMTPGVAPTAATSLLERMRAAPPAGPSEHDAPRSSRPRAEAEESAPNDLRSYLQRRAALQNRDVAKEPRRKEPAPAKQGQGRIGPVLKSLEAVLDQVRVRTASTSRTILVTPGAPDIDATGEAIRIARALLAGKQRGVLVDLTRGPTAVSGRLGLPPAPGFTDLAAGRAGFDDVIQIDEETPLQVIPAGNPTVRLEGDATEKLARIFDALSKAYDFVVLHANPDTAWKLEPALAGRPQLVVAVLAQGGGARSGEGTLADFTAFGCPIVPYEQPGGGRRAGRSGLVGHPAAV